MTLQKMMVFQASFCFVLLSHAISGVFAVDSQTCETIVPVNTAAKLGERAELKCRLSSPNVVWTFCPRKGQSRIITSNNCEVVQSAAANYKVDKTSNSCNLVIDNVTDSQLGSYTCQDLSLSDNGHSAELGNSNENLALRKKTIHSPDYAASTGGSNLAVDGNRDAIYTHGSCSATNPVGSSTWWAVDLEQKTSVGRVTITNRVDAVPERLQQFFIALTDVSPWTSAPNLTESSICTFYYGIPPPGFPLDIYCDANTQPGRYLFVFVKRAETLTLCELEIYYK